MPNIRSALLLPSSVKRAGFVFDIDREIHTLAEGFDETVSDLILEAASAVAAGNNKRGARFIDQNGVGFIDDGEIESAKNTIEIRGHVITEIVEAKFGVGGVSDVASVSGFLSLRWFLARLTPTVKPRKR
jgi:hypothetical protein